SQRAALQHSRKPTVPASRLLTIRAIFRSDCAFGELHEDRPRWWLPRARNEPHSFRWRSIDAWRPKGLRHDQARPIGARDPIAAFPFPAEARSTEERSQGPLSDQGSETVRRRAIPSPEANTTLTNDPWMTSGVGTFGISSAQYAKRS